MKCSIDALYANNEIYEVKLYLSLSYLDWCKLLKKEEFLHLIKYLNNHTFATYFFRKQFALYRLAVAIYRNRRD